MEYSDPYPSSVPHITLVPADFALDKQFYISSLAVHFICSFVTLFLLALTFHFACGNHKLLIDQRNNNKNPRETENIICQVLQKTDYLQKLQMSSEDSTSTITHMAPYTKRNNKSVDIEADLFAQKLRLYERRVVYSCIFLIPSVICVNSFSANILLVILLSIFVGLVAVFNVMRMIPNWKVTLLIYFLPALACLGPYMSNTDTLYEWQPVVQALEI